MKKSIYAALSLLILSFGLMAQPPQPPPERGRCDMMDRGHARLGGDSFKLFRRAGIILSDEQVNRIYNISLKFVSDMQPIEIEMRKIDYEIRLELMKDNPDRSKIKDLIYKKKNQEALRDYLRIERDLNIIEVLTSEQKSQLKDYQMSKGKH